MDITAFAETMEWLGFIPRHDDIEKKERWVKETSNGIHLHVIKSPRSVNIFTTQGYQNGAQLPADKDNVAVGVEKMNPEMFRAVMLTIVEQM
jgi:hypothetical protein